MSSGPWSRPTPAATAAPGIPEHDEVSSSCARTLRARLGASRADRVTIIPHSREHQSERVLAPMSATD